MAAGVYDLYIEQGATYSRVVTWKDQYKVPLSLVGYTMEMQIREKFDSASVIATSAGTSPTITLTSGGVAGTITITIAKSVTASFSFESAVYDLELTKTSDGTVIRLLEGEVFLSKEATK